MTNRRFSIFIADYQYFGDVDYFNYEVSEFNKAGMDVHFGTCTTEDDLIRQGQKMDAILLCNNPPMGRKAFESLPDCKLVLRYGIGYNSIHIGEATRHKKLILYMPGYCAEELATHASSLILALSRNTVFHDRQIRSGNWNVFDGYKLRRLSGQTLGLFGFGASGRILAQVFSLGWGMRVVAFDPYASAGEASERNVSLVSFDKLVRESDIISIHAPLTKDTYHVFSENEFKMMKPTAMIVNVSRGAIINQKALVKALREKEIQAAGLDVFETEPLDEDEPLLSLNNVIVTPHSAYYTEDSSSMQHKIAVETVIQALNGLVPYNAVNPEAVKKT